MRWASGSWSYSDNDPNWVQCVIQYNLYCVTGGNQAVYYDWTVQGGGNINYGVIDYQLPNDAKVLLIGDWATGQNDAVTLLTTAIATLKPTAILHLGDVYYSGTTTECQTKVVNVFSAVFRNPNTPQVPVFMIPGNHEYYAGGQGFYNSISVLNTGLNDCQQQASYFVLRTQDQTWQFLAMDTGIGDHDANTDALGTIGLNPTATGPALRPTEAQWHIDKLTNFSGNTILLSHHQLFSANAKINGWLTPDPAYLNTSLFGTFFPYFGTVSAWFWGHEHNFAAFQNGLFGLNMGRLLGNSAYEEMQSNNPYTVNYPAVPYASNMVQVGLARTAIRPSITIIRWRCWISTERRRAIRSTSLITSFQAGAHRRRRSRRPRCRRCIRKPSANPTSPRPRCGSVTIRSIRPTARL